MTRFALFTKHFPGMCRLAIMTSGAMRSGGSSGENALVETTNFGVPSAQGYGQVTRELRPSRLSAEQIVAVLADELALRPPQPS